MAIPHVPKGEYGTPEQRLAALVFNFDTVLEPRESLKNDILWHFNEIVRQEREACAAEVEKQGRLLKAIFGDDRHGPLCRNLAAAIRRFKE